ncbi:MAG: hypothetical protein MZW92_03720 [Comamonadaceae bacterium]|nr:hypothetical protein [Comamonadaceae bacterium]
MSDLRACGAHRPDALLEDYRQPFGRPSGRLSAKNKAISHPTPVQPRKALRRNTVPKPKLQCFLASDEYSVGKKYSPITSPCTVHPCHHAEELLTHAGLLSRAISDVRQGKIDTRYCSACGVGSGVRPTRNRMNHPASLRSMLRLTVSTACCAFCFKNSISDGVSILGEKKVAVFRLGEAVEAVAE